MRSNISIIICTWNRADSLYSTLMSLNEQADCNNLDVEVVVVDNNSTDNTKQIVDLAQLNWRLGDLNYVFEPRQGKQFALNHGVQLAKFSILAFTDDDILFPDNWVANVCEVFSNEALELAGGKTLLIWPDAGKPNWYQDDMSAILGGVDLGDVILSPPPAGYSPAGGNLIARRSLFDRVGGYSEIHFRHMDHEFGLRCARLGANVAYEPTLVVYAPVDNTCLTKRYFRRWSFKAGIVSDKEQKYSGKTFLLVPIWVYRQLINDLCFLFFRSFFVDEKVAFKCELRMWRMIGMIASLWYAKCWPSQYSEWVKRYSQKKNNLY